MPSYQERSRLIKQLTEQAYFDALKREDAQKKDVRVGGVDGRTGRYQVFSADGGLSSNGVPTSNAAPPSDGFVRGLQSPNVNAISLGWRKYVAEDIVRVAEEVENQFVAGNLAFTSINYFGGGDDFVLFSTANITSNGLLEYFYFQDSLEFFDKGVFNIASNTYIPIAAEGSVYDIDFSGDNNRIIFDPINMPASSIFADFEVYFDKTVWEDVFSGWLGSYFGATFSTAPVELEISLNGLTQSPSLQIGFSSSVNAYFIRGDCFLIPAEAPVTFSFRYRKRVTSGDPLPWFALV